MTRRRDRARGAYRSYRGQAAQKRRERGAREWRRLPEPVRTFSPVAILLTLAILYPFYLSSLPTGNVPLIYSFPSVGNTVMILVFTMMAVGLNVVVGYCGLLDLGYVAFYAAGAYTAGWFASGQFEQVKFHFGSVGISHDDAGSTSPSGWCCSSRRCSPRYGGILIGLPTLRLRGDYLAIVTLGFGEIIPQFVRNADNFHGFDLTHGTFGISPIDSPGFGSRLHDSLGLPVSFSQSFTADRLFYWTALALLLITVFCCIRLRDSRLGRAWIAIREDETAAAAMGVPLMRTKTWAYAIGAFFGGVAGAFIASFNAGAFPSQFYFNISVFLLCMVILGGMGSIWGVVVAGVILSWLNVEGLANIGTWLNDNIFPPSHQIEVAKYQFGIYGMIIVLMMMFRPQGLIPEAGASARSRRAACSTSRSTRCAEPDEPGAGERGARRTDSERMSEQPTTTTASPPPAQTGDLLVAAEVRKEFGGLVAVNDVNFTIPTRAIVSLIGPNGAGKTTFFNMLTGLYKATDGPITFDGDDVTDKPPHAITERGVGRTFQNIRLFKQMTALENVLVGMHSRLTGGILGSVFGLPRVRREEREAAERARELLELLRPARRRRRARRSRSPTATSAASRWRARSRPSRSCCCSTSRPRA